MLSSAAEFVTNQVLTTTLWNLAESGVHYTQQVVGHYLATTGGGAGTSLTADSAFQMDPETPQSKKIYCISFNQDCSSLAVGHDDGCSFYSLRSLDKLEKIQDAKVPERACIVEKLFSSSLITVVSLKSTRKLQVYHSTKENEICSHTYASSIIVVRMNRKRVIVCLEDAIHIHNVRDMRLMHIIKDTPPNPQGIMDLSNDDNNCFLAFPASSNTGHVHIFDAENLNTLCQIAAHDGVLAAIRFNPEGNKLATGSEKGTVIRVFSIPTGERLFEFTRGVSRCVSISSLAFSQDSRFLCLSSNTETIHVFALIKREQQQTEHSIQKPEETSQEKLNTWVSYLSQQASAYLPQQVNDLMLREKSATTARLPLVGARTAVAMPRIQGSDYLLVASFDGYLFVYSLPSPIESGECMFIKQFRIGPARVSPHEGEQDYLEGKPISIANRSSQRSSRTSESESQKPQTPTKPQSAAATMRAGTGGGSTSSLSSSSGTPTTKQVPPPMPPNPPKRITSKSATPVKEFAKSNTNTGNPFDMEDLVVPLDDGGFEGRTGGDGASTNESQLNIIPPADLNDLDEFPPLHHATT